MEGFFSYIAREDTRHIIDQIVMGKAKYRVSCFAKSYKKFLLWSYYTNKHRGVCLEYEVDRKHLPPEWILQKVEYSLTLPLLDETETVDDQVKKFLMTKIKCWEQEREVRLLVPMEAPPYTVSFGQLTGIILGAKFDESEHADNVRRQLRIDLPRPAERKVSLYQASIHGNRAEMMRQPIRAL